MAGWEAGVVETCHGTSGRWGRWELMQNSVRAGFVLQLGLIIKVSP
ncbi:hypothetical protein MC7420_2935 [Coleofasciculus chthonoplastes PCC 7420]|uniref:Uncharacterized protein n=1 Tax=Coleofasciculus chthonoplastes PCC 7420 TaxID=118168 RepID=B4VKN5_9CYAN|nr:hypothetical protein MC7420_2935 [Coleofasciculus chthonoplastes PCC 7420]